LRMMVKARAMVVPDGEGNSQQWCAARAEFPTRRKPKP
jgi:hypothetical protein